MATPVTAPTRRELQREWWRRLAAVLWEPRAVFRAMREDTNEAAAARQEPILLVIVLAGIAAVLAFSVSSGELLDDPRVDGIVVVILSFLAGGIYGLVGYFVGGGALYLGIRGASGDESYRRARHILGYALVPVALSLVVVWPIRVAVFGGDNFRTGGADEGAPDWVFNGIQYAAVLWTAALLALGVREVHGWTAIRSLGALLLAVLALTGMAVLAVTLSSGG